MSDAGRRSDALPRDARIAIVGGGPSGVTAAYTLAKRGYRSVTLFEEQGQIGGKVVSAEVEGQNIELGAILAMRENETLYRMSRDVGVLKLVPVTRRFPVIVQKPDGSLAAVAIDRNWDNSSTFQVLRSLIAFSWTVRRPAFRKLFRPGFYNPHPDLTSLTTTEFAKKYGFASILELFHVVVYICGYGSIAEHPALYGLKMIRSVEKVRRRRIFSFGMHPGIWTFAGGFQALWEGVAIHLVDRGLALRLNARVTAVTRETMPGGQTRIAVTSNGTAEHFDALIVATPPVHTLGYLDADAEERDLFGRVRYSEFHTVVFRARGLDERNWMSLRYNMHRERDGHIVNFLGGRPGSGLFIGYLVANGRTPIAELNRNLADDIGSIGGTLEAVVLRRAWTYFPHVGMDEVRAGYFERLNALQGRRETYFLGALFALETIEHCAQFAEFIVDQHFVRASTDR